MEMAMSEKKVKTKTKVLNAKVSKKKSNSLAYAKDEIMVVLK